jgi:ferrochelatase
LQDAKSVQRDKTAVLLVNLGTPDAPDEESIRRYLKQFLSDPRVVNLPRWLWMPILNLFILRFRPPKLVEKYRLVWGTHDGPIRNITRALGTRLQQGNKYKVVTAMTYGAPSVSSALDSLEDFERLIVIPLFPQYAGATTGAVKDALAAALKGREQKWQIDFVEDYYREDDYINAVANSIRHAKSYRDGAPMVVFSFHGIPRSQSDQGDPYTRQCEETAELIVEKLGIARDRWRLTYQSRFGPAEWVRPYTDQTMSELPKQHVRDVLVVCPGFSVDCLETIEEIKVLNQEIFVNAGGETFNYVKALNATQDHVNLMQEIAEKRLLTG